MAKQSIGDLHAKVTANASQFVSEFSRADNAARRTATNIDKEVGQLSKSLARKWSLSDIGKDLAKGFGLGSGFAVAQTAADLLVRHFEKAAEAAKSIEESTARQLEITRQIIALHQTDAQKRATLEAEFARKGRELEEAKKPKTVTRTIPGGTDFGGSEYTEKLAKTAAETAAIHKLAEEYAQLGLQIEQLNKKEQDKRETERADTEKSDRERRIRALTEGLRQQEEAFDALIKKQHDANEQSSKARKEAEQLAEKYKELADPTLRFTKQIEEVNKLLADGKLNAEQAARAIAELKREMAEDEERRINKALDDFFGGIDSLSKLKKVETAADEFEQHMSHMWQNVSDRAGQAFADVLLTGKGAFGDLVDIVARSVVEIAAQLLIINPILNGIFGGMPGFSKLPAAFSFGGGKARGGAVEPGFTYMVNEDRQEFFRPSVGGEVMPIGPSGTREGGGDTFNFHYNFATGVTKSELMPLLALQQRDTLAKIADAKRRRTAVGAAL